MDLLALLPVAPQALAWAAGALVFVLGLLYVAVDAVNYRRIPTLDVPLNDGAYLGAAGAQECNGHTRLQGADPRQLD